MKIHIALTLLATIFLAGCTEEKVYSPKDVKIISEGITDKGLELTFLPMAESVYYCPGVIYEQKGSQVYFKFVRRNRNKKDADIHLSATQEKDGSLSVTFPFPKDQERIELINSLGKSLGEWERGKEGENN